jgi:cell division protein ZapA
MSERKSVVRVTIVGEEYSIKSEMPPDHTRAVAQYLDQAIRKVMNSGSVVESQRAAILAALQITSELFQARETADDVDASMRSLGSEIKRWLPPAKREVERAKAES